MISEGIKETDTRGAAPDPGHLSCPPKKDGAKKGAPVKIPAAFSGGLGTALKLAPQGRKKHYQNGASNSHRGLTLRPCRPPGIFKGVNIQTKTRQTVTTKYVYDGLDIVQEIQSGTVTANYIRTMNIDEPLMRVKSDGTMRFYKTDALGSVIQLTDETGGVRTTYSYDPFGNVTVSGEASDNPFQFAGRENDGSGLYYYRARYYSPELQRFISEDPIGFAAGDVNFYAYVGNSPVNAVDPLGLAQCYLIFNNGKGRLMCFPENPANKSVDIPVASGNNGDGLNCKNNQSCSNQFSRGPIPAGDYTWIRNSSSKPNGRTLLPNPGNKTRRYSFASHSCLNAFGPSLTPPFCSEGCVTGQASDIKKLNKLLDSEPYSRLHVVGGEF